MKGARKFIILMVLLFVGLFVLQMRLPKKFVWNQTYSHADKQPFGCYVFDSVLSQSMPNGYQVTRQSFLQINEAYKGKNVSVLTIMDSQDFSSTDVNQLLAIANRGGKVMLVYGSEQGEELAKKLKVEVEGYNSFNLNYLLRKKGQGQKVMDFIYWDSESLVYPNSKYLTYDDMLGTNIKCSSDIPATRLAYCYNRPYNIRRAKESVAVSVPYGKGKVFLLSTPLLFTNYGMLTGNTSEYIFRLMSQIADLPVIRTEAYMTTEAMMEAQQSPLREFVKRPALRWALYLTMLGVILFMIFTARRRQRVIPIITPPANKSLEFIQLIGTLYYQRKDHADLVRKKFLLFTAEVRRRSGINISDVNNDGSEYPLLAEKMGMQPAEVERILREIRLVIHSELNIPVEQMRRLIDAMNGMLDRL